MLPLKASGDFSPRVTDDDLEAAVERFVRDAETAYEEYERGYADADAVLGRLRSHLDRLQRELD